MTQYLFSLCDLGQHNSNNRSSETGSSGGLNRISKQFLKIHHDGSYHSFVSRQMAIALKRFINTKFSKSIPEFVTEVHKKLLCLHEYNLEVAKVKSKYPRSRQLDDLLIRYIELECECLYNGRHKFDDKQENYVQKRILKLLHVILFEIFKNNENSIKDTRDLCLKTIIKFFVTVRAECCNDNNIINNVITNLIEKLGLLDEINKFKGKCIPFHLDTCLQDPEISKVRRTLTTSDYESDSSDSDDDFEFSTSPLTYPTTENFSTVSLADMNAIDLSDDDDSFDQAKFKHKPRTFETTQIKNEILQFSPIINNISTDPISILSDDDNDDDDDEDNSNNEVRNDSITNQDLSNGAGNKLTGIKNKCHNNNDDNSNSIYPNIINTSNHNSRAQLNGDFINVQRTSTNSTTFTDGFDRFLTNERNYTNVSNTESDIITITDDDDYDFHKITTQLTSNDKNHMPIPILDLDHIKTEVNDEDRSPNLAVNGQINSNILQQTTTLARVNTDMEDMALQSNSTNQPLEAETNLHITEIHEEIVENISNSDSNRENVIISQVADDNTVEIAKNINNDVISQKAVENTVENNNVVDNDGSNVESLVISENLQQTEEIATIETTEGKEKTIVTIESVEVIDENLEISEHISNEDLNKSPESVVESIEVSENVKLVSAIDENIDKLSDIDATQEIEKTMEDSIVEEMSNFEDTTNIESVENCVDNETIEKVALDLENSEENSAVDEFIDGITEIIDNISENSETPDEIAGNCETENYKNTEELNNIEIKEIEQFKNIDNENFIDNETIECVEKIIQFVEHELATCNADEMPENIEEIEKNTGNNEMINSQEEIIETIEQSTDTEIISKNITETSIQQHENIEKLFENCTIANNETINHSGEEEIIEMVEKSTDIEVTSTDITETEVEEHESIEKLSENNVTLDNSTLEVAFNEDIVDETIKETKYTEISSSEITGDTVIAHEICIESEIIDENSQNSQIASNDTVEANSEEKLPTATSKDGKSNEILEISTETITESQLNEDSIGNDKNKRSEIAENVTEIDQNNTVEDNEHGNEVCKLQKVETDGNLVEICQTQDDQVEMLETSTEIVQSSLLEDKGELDKAAETQPEIIEDSTEILQNEHLENIEELSQSQLEICDNSDSVLQNQVENTGNSTEISPDNQTEIVSDTPIDVIVKDRLENTEILANINREDQTNSNENSIIPDQKSENLEQTVEILKESQEKIVEDTEITNDLVIDEKNMEISEDFNGDVSKNQLEMTKKVDTVIDSSIEEINVVESFDKSPVQPEMINESMDETPHQIESPQNGKTENNGTFTYESTQTLNEVEYIDPTHNLGVLATTALAIADSSTVTVTSLPQKSPEIDESMNNNKNINTSKRRRSKVRLESGEILPRPHQQQKRLRRHKLEISNENKRITRNSINNNNNIKHNQLEMIKSPKSNRYNNDITTTTKCLAHDFISTENSSIPPQINHVYAQKRLVEANTTSEDSNDSSESTLFIDESNEWKNDKINERNYNSIYEEETEDDCLKFIDTELNDDDDDDHDDDNRKVTQTEKKCEEVVENKSNSSVCISIPDDNDNNQFADNEVLKQMENFVETQCETVDNAKQIEEISFDRNEIVHKKFDHEKFIKEKTIQQVDDKLKDNNKIPTDHSIKHILNNVNEQNIKDIIVDNNEDTSSKLKETDENSITNPTLTVLEDRIIKTKGALKSFDQEKENTATLIENCFESGKNRKIIRSRSKSCNQIINDNVKEKINFNDDFSITKNSKLVTDIVTLKNTKIKIKKNSETKQINEEIEQVESNKNQSEVLLDLSIGDKNKTSDIGKENIEQIAITTPQEQIEIIETTRDLSNKTPIENLINIEEQNEVVLNNLIIHEKKLETKVGKLELYDTTKPQFKKSPTRDKSKALENTIKKMKERVIKEKNSSEQTHLLNETDKFEGDSSSNLIPSIIETKSEKGSNRKQGRTNIDDKSESSKTNRKSSDRHHRSTRSSSKSKTDSKHRENDKKDDRHRSSRSKSIEICVERSRSRSKSKSKSNNNNNNSEKERKHSSRSKSKERNIRKTHSSEKDRKERSKTPTTKIKSNDKDKVNNNHTDNKEERSKSKDTKSHRDIDKNRKVDKSRSKSPRNLPTDSNKDIDLNKIRDDLKKSLTKNNQETKQKDTKNSRGHSKEKKTIDSDKEKKEKLHKSHRNGDKTKHNLDDNKKHEEKPEKSDSKTKHKIDDNIKKNGVKNEQLNLRNKQKIDDDKNEKLNAKTKNKSNESNKKIEANDIECIDENNKRNEEKIEKSNEENKSNNEEIEMKKSDKSKEKNKLKETVNEDCSTKQVETKQKKKTSIDEIFEEAFKRAELERKSKQQLIVNNEENKDATNTVSEPNKINENQETRKRRFNDSEEGELEENKRPKLTENSEESPIEEMQIENLDHGKIILNIPPPPPPLHLLPPPPPPPPSSPPPLPPPPPLPTSPPPPPPPLPPEIVDETKTADENQAIKTNLEISTKAIPKTNNENFERIDAIVTPGSMELESPTKILLTNDIQTTDTFFVNNTFSTACNLNMQVLSSTVDTTVKDFPTETVTSTNLQTSVSIHCGVIAQSVNLVNTTQDPSNLTNNKNCLFTFSNDTTTPTSTVTNSSNLTTLNDLEQMELITTPHHSHPHHHHHHQHHRTTHVMVSLSDSIDVVQNNPPVVETEVVEIQDYDGSFNLGGPMVSGRREEKTITTPTDLTLTDSSPDEFPLTSEELELSFNDNNLIDDYFNPCKTEKPDFDNNIIIDANDTITTKTDEIQNSIKDLNYLIGITQNDEQNKNDNNDNDIEDDDDVSSNSNSTDIDDRTINRPPTDSINDATLYAVNNLISLGSGDSSETHTFTSISDIDIMETSKEAINNLNSAIPSTSTTPDIVTKPTYPSNYLPNQPIENTTMPIISNNNDDIGDKIDNNENNDEATVQKVIVQKIEQAPISIDILEKSYLNNCKPVSSSTSSSSVTVTKNSVSKFIQSVKRNESTKKNDVNDVMEKFTGRKHNRTPVSAPRRNQQKPISSTKSSPQDDLSIDNSNKETQNFSEMRIRVKKDLGATLFDTDLLQEQQQRHSYAVENRLNLRTNDGEQQSTSDSETSRKRKHLYDDCNGDNEKRRRKSDDSIDDREKRNNEIFDKLLKQGPINKCMLTQNPISSASTSSSSSSIVINTRNQEILAKNRADNERQEPKYQATVTTTRSEMLNYPSSSSSSSSGTSTSSNNNRREGAKYRSTETRQRYTSYPRNLERRHHTDPVVSRSGKWYVKPLLMHSATMRHDRPIYPYIKPEDRKLSAADAEHLRQTYGQTVRNPRLQKDDDKFLWLQKCSGIFDSPPLFEVPENN